MNQEDKHNCIDLNQTKRHIEDYGLSIVVIEKTDYLPSFAYSVGLNQTYNHPEIICFGLKTDLLKDLINDIAALIQAGETFEPNKDYLTIFGSTKAQFLNIDPRNIEDYFGVALLYYETKELDALQLVWPDRNHNFPWEEAAGESFKAVQPLLDRNADFKFREAKNLGVFTTREWLEGGQAILRVIHEEDGDWQFLTDNDITEDNGKLVALEQLVLRDPTLNDAFDLEYGEEYVREFVGGKWRRSKIEE